MSTISNMEFQVFRFRASGIRSSTENEWKLQLKQSSLPLISKINLQILFQSTFHPLINQQTFIHFLKRRCSIASRASTHRPSLRPMSSASPPGSLHECDGIIFSDDDLRIENGKIRGYSDQGSHSMDKREKSVYLSEIEFYGLKPAETSKTRLKKCFYWWQKIYWSQKSRISKKFLNF